jgi:phosphatidylethanolamine-binding protein (PEBP) family uncharacterized protein
MRRRALLASLSAAATAGCTIGGEPPKPDDLSLTAPAFEDGRIPVRYTCDGAGDSPPLRVEGVPEPAGSLAVGGEWLYGFSPRTVWLLWRLPPADPLEIPAGLPDRPRLESPEGAVQGTNDEGFVGYRSPCHETPEHDEYRFSLLALETAPDVEPGATREDFDDAVEGLVVSSTSLTATYDRA